MPKCGECEYFGDFDKMILGEITEVPGSDGRQFYRPFIKFDESGGCICQWMRRNGKHGTETRTYPELDADGCPHFTPRTWDRPEFCHDCNRKYGASNGGIISCDGYPFYGKKDDKACQNGRIAYGAQMKLF